MHGALAATKVSQVKEVLLSQVEAGIGLHCDPNNDKSVANFPSSLSK